MTERRRQRRITDAELIMLCWHEDAVTAKQLGNIVDLSSDGAGVLVDHSLPAGTPVIITYDGQQTLSGIIRHSGILDDRYFVGIEFTDSAKDSPLHFQPELLVRE